MLTRILIVAAAILMMLLAILLAGSATLRYLFATPVVQTFEWSQLLLWGIAMLAIPLLIKNQAISERRSAFPSAPILVQLAIFIVLASSALYVMRFSIDERMDLTEVSQAWLMPGVVVGCMLSIMMLVSHLGRSGPQLIPRLSTIPPRAAKPCHIALALLVLSIVVLSLQLGAHEALKVTTRILNTVDSSQLVAIAMMALVGELARTMGAEIGARKIAQSVFAGARSAPLLAPILASSLQGPMLMRSGRAFEGEVAREASQMLTTMEAQGIERHQAWCILAASGACALALPPAFLAVIGATASEVSIVQLMSLMLISGLLLFALLTLVAVLVSRNSEVIQPVPALGSDRLRRIWRDGDGMAAQVFWPIIILAATIAGITTLSEIAGMIAVVGFFVALLHPLRPRFKDLATVLQRSSIVTAEILVLFAVALVAARTLQASGLQPILTDTATNMPVAVSVVLLGLVLPSALSFAAGLPIALVMSSVLLGSLAKPFSQPTVVPMLLIFATLLGAALRSTLAPAVPLGEFGNRDRLASSLIWCTPILLVWLVIALGSEWILWPVKLIVY
jgi:TRAP-type C4-dicarboxylate transport system permease large subunit/TRAP-type C4-dicarboxylate transport system permease small subunit